MFEAQKHANVWIVIRTNSEGPVTSVKSYKSQRAAERFASKLNAA